MKALVFKNIIFMSFAGCLTCSILSCSNDEEESMVMPDEKVIVRADSMVQCIEAVDLGLSVLWATCNVDAASPEQCGGYYAWGETKIKEEYTYSNYRLEADDWWWIRLDNGEWSTDIGKESWNDGLNDVVYLKWGSDWHYPSELEFQELTTSCTWRWEERNGVKGNLVTGPNGNSIFLPAAGYRSGTETFNYSTGGYYWSVESDYVDDGDTEFLKQSAVGLYFLKNYSSWDFYNRHLGFQIRPVKDKQD